MRRHQREIGFILMGCLVVGSVVSFFFHQLKREKSETAVTVYSFVPPHPEALLCIQETDTWLKQIPPHPEALLCIQETDTWLKQIASGERERRLFESHIPVFFIHLFEATPAHEVLFSFHNEGVICLVKATPFEAKRLSATTRNLLANYPPEKQIIGTTQLTYYTDGPQRFLGTFYREGIWVASYHKRLLEQAWQTDVHLNPKGDCRLSCAFPWKSFPTIRFKRLLPIRFNVISAIICICL